MIRAMAPPLIEDNEALMTQSAYLREANVGGCVAHLLKELASLAHGIPSSGRQVPARPHQNGSVVGHGAIPQTHDRPDELDFRLRRDPRQRLLIYFHAQARPIR